MRAFLVKLWTRETPRAALILLLLLHVPFFQCIWGHRTLLESARDAPSIIFQGAWEGNRITQSRFNKVADPGAGAWFFEPWLALIHNQYFHEHTLPLWNPYQGFGQSLAANMQSQPFYPPTVVLSLHLTPRTYNWYILFRLFIAGFCAYLYFRLFLSFLPALAGGITMMLCGYYLLFIAMTHLSVDTLLPATFLSAELLLRKPRLRTFLFFTAILLLVILAGMPESAVLILSFSAAYILFRIASDASFRRDWLAHLKRFALATLSGLALSAFFLLPFAAYAQRSATSHGPEYHRGLIHDSVNSSVLTYVFPTLFGPVNGPTLASHGSYLRNYLGIIAFFFLLLAIAGVFRRRRDGEDSMLTSLTGFFLVWLLLVIAKRYGFGPVNAIGSLPVFESIDFPKYQELILSFCGSALCAIGVERLIKRQISVAWKSVALALSLALLCVGLYQSRLLLSSHLADRPTRALSRIAIDVPAVLLLLLGICLVQKRMREHIGLIAVALLSLEVTLNYVIPVYHVFNRMPHSDSNPFAGAPFIQFLNSRTQGYRTFARDGVLMPNWSSSFGLSDIRDIDSMYNLKYFPFLEAFFPTWQQYLPDLGSCFRGLGDYSFADPLERRLLQLSSVKYIATVRPYSAPNPMIEAILKQNQGRLAPGKEKQVGHDAFQIGGITRDTLGEHPPYQQLPFHVQVPESHPIFEFSYGIAAGAFDKPGDGVRFTVECRDSNGRITQLFSKYVDPKHQPDERRWMDAQLDLTALRGRWIDLLFTTDPGPKGDNQFDWAGWSNFHFDELENTPTYPFRQVFQGDIGVFEYDDVLPRAALFFHAEVAPTEADALRKLASPSFDVFRTVALARSQLNPDQLRAISQVNSGGSRAENEASITSYRSQSVQLKATLDQPGILMLNDTADPDWIARVDGRNVAWFPVDYMFRGLLLQPGTHLVEFIYRPRAFYWGCAISSVTLLALIAFAWIRRTRFALRAAPHRISGA